MGYRFVNVASALLLMSGQVLAAGGESTGALCRVEVADDAGTIRREIVVPGGEDLPLLACRASGATGCRVVRRGCGPPPSRPHGAGA